MLVRVYDLAAFRKGCRQRQIAIRDISYTGNGQCWAEIQHCHDKTVVVDGLKYQSSVLLEEGDLVITRGGDGVTLSVGTYTHDTKYIINVKGRVVRKWEQ